MSPVGVFLDHEPVGEIFRTRHRGRERISFRYLDPWLASDAAFEIDPDLPLDRRTSAPTPGPLFGVLTDAAPDRWGRRLMQRRERHAAELDGRAVRSLSELDYVLGVSDRSRMGALRFEVDGTFVSTSEEVPPLVRLRELLHATTRVVEGEETASDLALVLAPGSSLGGARPKASVLDVDGELCIAKFPRPDDEYSVERWEMICNSLARAAGIRAAEMRLETVDERPILVSRRFDRRETHRIHYASAMTMLGLADGDEASYPEIAEVLNRHGSSPGDDLVELFRRMVFNICVADVDDHLRNHGFLRDSRGLRLSPAFDVNPVPMDIRPRVMSTAVTPDDFTGSLDAARSSAPYFDLTPARAEAIIEAVIEAIAGWSAMARRHGASSGECDRMESAFLTSAA
ncbi:MAG: type II toxin-antitoxin system HipA family toxin [Sandaracinaceae bacterium]|nr:MAG: type II toxin-antitoxin system HipA family toxin [Sandaracinaceae bacterium]